MHASEPLAVPLSSKRNNSGETQTINIEKCITPHSTNSTNRNFLPATRRIGISYRPRIWVGLTYPTPHAKVAPGFWHGWGDLEKQKQVPQGSLKKGRQSLEKQKSKPSQRPSYCTTYSRHEILAYVHDLAPRRHLCLHVLPTPITVGALHESSVLNV